MSTFVGTGNNYIKNWKYKNRTFGRHIHWRSRHTVEICPSHGYAGLSFTVSSKNLGGSKVGEFDVTDAIEQDV